MCCAAEFRIEMFVDSVWDPSIFLTQFEVSTDFLGDGWCQVLGYFLVVVLVLELSQTLGYVVIFVPYYDCSALVCRFDDYVLSSFEFGESLSLVIREVVSDAFGVVPVGFH